MYVSGDGSVQSKNRLQQYKICVTTLGHPSNVKFPGKFLSYLLASFCCQLEALVVLRHRLSFRHSVEGIQICQPLTGLSCNVLLGQCML